MVNPSLKQQAKSRLDLLMAGTRDALLMIEGFCDFMTEEDMLKVCLRVWERGAEDLHVCMMGGYAG